MRLKGGDPMLFGRADEEMRALEAAGIEYEVVPGITAALASAATLKRSLTLRGVSRSVALATHSRAADSDEIREQAKADSLVFYMGRDSAPDIAQQFIDAGRAGIDAGGDRRGVQHAARTHADADARAHGAGRGAGMAGSVAAEFADDRRGVCGAGVGAKPKVH